MMFLVSLLRSLIDVIGLFCGGFFILSILATIYYAIKKEDENPLKEFFKFSVKGNWILLIVSILFFVLYCIKLTSTNTTIGHLFEASDYEEQYYVIFEDEYSSNTYKLVADISKYDDIAYNEYYIDRIYMDSWGTAGLGEKFVVEKEYEEELSFYSDEYNRREEIIDKQYWAEYPDEDFPDEYWQKLEELENDENLVKHLCGKLRLTKEKVEKNSK